VGISCGRGIRGLNADKRRDFAVLGTDFEEGRRASEYLRASDIPLKAFTILQVGIRRPHG
jgi:hypothetical protein